MQSESITDETVPGTMFYRLTLLAFGVILWVVLWYRDSVLQLAGIWWRSDTFAHGMVVAPVFIWLLWLNRQKIAVSQLRPDARFALCIALGGFIWLLGNLSSVDVISHLGVIAVCVALIAGIFGIGLAKTLTFPLLFWFFAWPVGDFLQPLLMQYTADFTVSTLRMTQVPVYQEALYFILPDSRWSVVEACSGLRYIVASLFVGAIYAYLHYRSLGRRLLFMGVALLVPVIANWVRAYLTVMMGYLFGSDFVDGLVHIIYGWVFFGIVLLLMFTVGELWHEKPEDDLPEVAIPANVAMLPPRTMAMCLIHVLVLGGVSAVFPLLARVMNAPVAPFNVSLNVPSTLGAWVQKNDTDVSFTPHYDGYRGQLKQTYYRQDGVEVTLYVAYYAQQRSGSELVAWRNRLLDPQSDDRVLSSAIVTLPTGKVRYNKLHIHTLPQPLQIWHWYWIDHGNVVYDPIAKLHLAFDRLLGRGDDSAFVAIYVTNLTDRDDGEAIVTDFIGQYGDAIESLLSNAAASVSGLPPSCEFVVI